MRRIDDHRGAKIHGQACRAGPSRNKNQGRGGVKIDREVSAGRFKVARSIQRRGGHIGVEQKSRTRILDALQQTQWAEALGRQSQKNELPQRLESEEASGGGDDLFGVDDYRAEPGRKILAMRA